VGTRAAPKTELWKKHTVYDGSDNGNTLIFSLSHTQTSTTMVHRLDDDSSFSSFADYVLGDSMLGCHDDDSFSSVDLSYRLLGGHDELFVAEVTSSKTTSDTTTITTTTGTTKTSNTTTATIRPTSRKGHLQQQRPVKKTVRFVSAEIRYFTVRSDGRTHVTEHRVELLQSDLPQKSSSSSMITAEERWRPYVVASLCRRR
jgi:hypothetical protein